MDPLSITAGIIALLQASNAIVSIAYSYKSLLRKEQPSQFSKFIDEVHCLRDVLETLADLAIEAERGKANSSRAHIPALKLLCQPSGILDQGLEKLEKLEERLKPPSYSQSGRKRAIFEVLSWPIKEAETAKIIEDIAKLKLSLSLAMSADQTWVFCCFLCFILTN